MKNVLRFGILGALWMVAAGAQGSVKPCNNMLDCETYLLDTDGGDSPATAGCIRHFSENACTTENGSPEGDFCSGPTTLEEAIGPASCASAGGAAPRTVDCEQYCHEHSYATGNCQPTTNASCQISGNAMNLGQCVCSN